MISVWDKLNTWIGKVVDAGLTVAQDKECDVILAETEAAIRANEREKTIQAIQDGTIAVGLMRRLTLQARDDERKVMAEELTENERGTIGNGIACDVCVHYGADGCEIPKLCPIRKAVRVLEEHDLLQHIHRGGEMNYPECVACALLKEAREVNK
jgi:hypothetical protein